VCRVQTVVCAVHLSLGGAEMKKCQNIIVGIELSESAQQILERALEWAKRFGAKLHVVHAIEFTMSQRWDAFPLRFQEVKERLEAGAWEKLEGMLEALPDKEHLGKSFVRWGRPDTVLAKLADEVDADLCLVGKINRTALERAMVGSTSRRLIRQLALPILALAPDATDRLKQVVIPVDFSEASEAALRDGIACAKREGAKVHILHVYEFLSVMPMIELWTKEDIQKLNDEAKEMVQEQMDTFLQPFDLDGVDVEIHLNEGYVFDEIVRFVRGCEADLLVMGSIGRSGIQSVLLGNTAERVIHNAPCSLMIIKPEMTS